MAQSFLLLERYLENMMEYVSFISIEDNPPDLILSFAIWEPEREDVRSIILLRTPRYESILDEGERGVKVSDEDWAHDEDEMLKEIKFEGDSVSIFTENHKFELNIRKVDTREVRQAKRILKKMNFDNRFQITIV